MKKTIFHLTFILLVNTLFGQNSEMLIDNRDGQAYRIVRIEKNLWMAENLNYYTKHSYYYKMDSTRNSSYGRLYRYFEANKVCPEGWHLPDQYVYTYLTDNLGGIKEAFDKFCEIGTTHWTVRPKSTATNSSGFTALPGGSYEPGDTSIIKRFVSHLGIITDSTISDAHPDLLGMSGVWWTSDSVENKTKAQAFLVNGWIRKCLIIDRNKSLGLSIRCIKD
jgi:uncharacterized protein (TIGR02145 family)